MTKFNIMKSEMMTMATHYGAFYSDDGKKMKKKLLFLCLGRAEKSAKQWSWNGIFKQRIKSTTSSKTEVCVCA